jgi:hypothetical protein
MHSPRLYWLLHSNIILFPFHSRFIWDRSWVKKQTGNNEGRSGQLKMSNNETYRPLAIPILAPLVIDRFEAIRRSDGVVGGWFGVGGGCLMERRIRWVRGESIKTFQPDELAGDFSPWYFVPPLVDKVFEGIGEWKGVYCGETGDGEGGGGGSNKISTYLWCFLSSFGIPTVKSLGESGVWGGENELLGERIGLVLAETGDGEGSFVRTIELKDRWTRDCGISQQAFGWSFFVLGVRK